MNLVINLEVSQFETGIEEIGMEFQVGILISQLDIKGACQGIELTNENMKDFAVFNFLTQHEMVFIKKKIYYLLVFPFK